MGWCGFDLLTPDADKPVCIAKLQYISVNRFCL